MPVPFLTLRIPKGSPLTPGEMDGDLAILRDFCNSLETSLLVIVDADGNPTNSLIDAITKSASYGDGTLAGTTYAVSLTPIPVAYAAGMVVWMRALTGNLGAVTLNVNGLGVKNIVKQVNLPLTGGEIPQNGIVGLRFDGTNFQLLTQYAAIGISQLEESARYSVNQYAVGVQSGGVYAATLNPAATQYFTGMHVAFRPDSANTGSVSINVNGLGSKMILKNGSSPLIGSELVANQINELRFDGSAFQLVSLPSGAVLGNQVIIIDQKASGTAGGTATAGSWQPRDMNTIKRNVNNTLITLASNQIKLKRGTYRCWISCPARECGHHQSRLYNVSATTTLLVGSSADASAGANTCSRSFIVGTFTLNDDNQLIEVQTRVENTSSTDGFGNAVNFGEVEVYTIAEFLQEG